MKVGTTPTHSFTLPIGEDRIRSVEITYCQNGEVVLQKYTDDCTINENIVSVTLSQMDTFEFMGGVNVETQIRVLDIDDNTFASNIVCVPCERCLSTEVLI